MRSSISKLASSAMRWLPKPRAFQLAHHGAQVDDAHRPDRHGAGSCHRAVMVLNGRDCQKKRQKIAYQIVSRLNFPSKSLIFLVGATGIEPVTR